MSKPWLHTREATWWVLAVFLVATVAVAAFVNLVFFRLDSPDAIVRATLGLIDWTLMGSAFSLLIVVGGVIFGLGRLRPAEVGLIAARLPEAIVVTALLWIATQALVMAGAWAALGEIPINPRWAERGVTVVIGALIAQLLGNALAEEIIYRGFLLPQSWLKLPARTGWRLLVAVLISQSIFALSHIPNRIFYGMTLAEITLDMLMLLLFGVYYAFLYLRTGNLFIAVGVHALANQPASIVQSDLPAPLLLALTLLLAIAWPKLRSISNLRSR
jgi:membrane protease YdiL (CAAX protease family)